MAVLARVIAQGDADLLAAIAGDSKELFRGEPSEDIRVYHRDPGPVMSGFVDTVLRQVLRVDVAYHIDFENFDFRRLLPWAQDIPGYRSWLCDVTQLTCGWCDWHRTEHAVLRLRTLDTGMALDGVSGLQLSCVYGGGQKSRRCDMAWHAAEAEGGESMYRVVASPDLVPPYSVVISTPKARQVLDFPRGVGQMPRRLVVSVQSPC